MNIQDLIQAGGKEWRKDDLHRVYFNDLPDLLGLETSHYKTGNISGASLNGETIANCRAREIMTSLMSAKFWYDVRAGHFESKRITSNRTMSAQEMTNLLARNVRAKIDSQNGQDK